MRLLLAAVAACLLSAPVSAHAEGPTREANKREWYGFHVLAADGATVASSSVLFLTTNGGDVTGYNFVAGHLLGAPIVHLAHENYAAAIGSLLLRAALPYAGAHIACELNETGPENDECRSADVIGAFVGVFVAGAIDAAAFSYAAPKAKLDESKSVQILPTTTLGRHGATFGLQAVF